MLSTLLLILTITGIAYAEWTDELVAIGKITTAKWHLSPSVEQQVWFDDGVDDTWKGIQKEYIFPYGYVYADECCNAFRLEFQNVYPCLTAHFKVDIHNDGEVPAAFNGIKYVYALKGPAPSVIGWNDDFPPSVLYDWSEVYPAHPAFYADVVNDYDVTITYPAANTIVLEVDPKVLPPEWYPEDKAHVVLITVVLSAEERLPDDPIDPLDRADPNSWVQIDPGYEVYADVTVHFGEYLEESSIYKFGWEMDFINWNELGHVPAAGPLIKPWGPP